MNKPLLIATLFAGMPACAMQATGQDGAPAAETAAAAPAAAQCGMPAEPPPATGALPARATVTPEPQRGSVAPNSRVPSQVVTPSMRAMERARAAQAGHVDKKAQEECAEPATTGSSARDRTTSKG